MMSTNNISVSFREFDVQGNCYADIILPLSGNKISGFKVKLGPGGGIMIHMPSGMGTTWAFKEIEWAEVRKQITEEYRRSTNNQPILVKLHSFDEKSNCLADITLRETGVVISDFKVMVGLGGGIMVHMPSWMHTRWSYTEIQWSEVRQIIAREYLSTVSAKERSTRPNIALDETRICTFYSSIVRVEATVTAIIAPSSEQIQGIQLVHTKDKDIIQVFMPREMNYYWNNSCIEWDRLVEIVINEYRRQVLDESCESVSDTVEIIFCQLQEVTICMADIKLPHKKNTIKGFRIKKIQGDEKVIISTPKWMGRWNDGRLSWYDLCSLITSEYNKCAEIGGKVADSRHPMLIDMPVLSENDTSSNEGNSTEQSPKQQAKEKDELGRIKNAENSSFVFYPRTVLRSVDSSDSKNSDSKKKLFDLVSALNKGSLGGIGPFEINILEWIAKLRYVSSTMLVDLIKAGYISFGWRSDVTQAKLGKIINRMADYGLITLTRFVTVNDDGSLDNSNYSTMRIITLGRNGSILLHELGKNTTRYNAFDIFQDGNTVKRFLTANQWLVYWLKTYREEIGEEYETSCIIHLKGVEYVGARIYATVTINDCPMVAEPVRRVEEFEIDSNKQWLREKIKRLSLLFDNLEQLYHGKDEISFPQRPIVVLVCEDDDHILEVWESIKSILPEINNQEIWFSSDLRIFNYNKKGERFLRFSNETPRPVDLKQVFGIDNEADNPTPMTDEFNYHNGKGGENMLYGDYSDLIHRVNRLSECTDEAIRLIRRLIDVVLALLDDNDRIQSGIDTYNNAICILEDVLRTNEMLREAAEAYMCCSSAPGSVIDFGFRPQAIEQGEHEPKEKDDAAAMKVAERRKALAEALRTGQPVMVNSDGTVIVNTDKSADSNVQINVSGSDVACSDSASEGIVVPSGKFAGSIPSHCRVCDNIVFSGSNYCPYCGTSVSADKPFVKLHKVQFSAVAPKVLTKGEYTIINVIMYEESYRYVVDELISTMDEPAQETRSGVQKVNEGAEIKIVLNSPDLSIEDNTETGIWQGEYLDFSFALQLPSNFKKQQVLLTASVYINDVIASKLKFVVKCSSLLEQKIQVSRSDIFSAFISYASQDRNRVATIIQGMKKARPDLDVFFDVDSLRSGDDWEHALHEEIERRDVLFLCWSHFARESKWVNAEWRYAFEKNGIDSIEPVPIESPDVCPPPEELRKKHFNDKLLYIINA